MKLRRSKVISENGKEIKQPMPKQHEAPKWFMYLVAIMLMCGLAAIMVPNGLAQWGFVAPLIAAIIAPAIADSLWVLFKRS
jgi:hypothetical protein